MPTKITHRNLQINFIACVLIRLLGFDIEGEQEPVVKNPKMKSWSKVTLPWMSIGYEVALTSNSNFNIL